MKAIAKPLSGVGVPWGLSIKFAVVIASPGYVQRMECCQKQWWIQGKASPYFKAQLRPKGPFNFFCLRLGSPPYLRVWMTAPPLKVWICHWKVISISKMVGLSLFSLLLNVWKKRCAWAALSRGVVFLKPTDISNWNWGLFFFLSVTFKVVSIRGSYFSEKLYFFNFLVSWRKVGFKAVYLSTLKQIFFLKLACCKVYPLIYSFVRRGITSTAITNVFLDNKQERDHLCAFDLGANYHKFNTLEKGYSDLFLHVFIKIWVIKFL